MKEAYVSYEVAKLLKEKGFTEFCLYYYQGGNPIRTCSQDRSCYEWNNNHIDEEWYSAPTHQMAAAWLREVYKMFISIGVGTDIDGVFGYMPSIYFLSILSCNEGRFVPNVDADNICNFTPQTYEDAVEAALEYCLTNLI